MSSEQAKTSHQQAGRSMPRRQLVFKIDCRNGRTQRQRCGEDSPKAKISNDTVEAVRTAYETGEGGYRKLGRRFDIHPTTVRDIVTYRRRAFG